MLLKKLRSKNLIEILMYVAVFGEAFVVLPQVYVIFHNKNAGNVSLATWLGYEALTVIWLAYAISKKDRPIILYSLICMLSQSGIILGILLY